MSLENTSKFGPLIKMILVMIKEVLSFMALWSVILIFFLCIGMLVFVDINEFKTVKSALVYLGMAALGNFDTTTFSQTWN